MTNPTNPAKKDGGQGGAGQGQQRSGGGGGGAMVRTPSQQMARDPFQMMFRDPFQWMREMMVDPFRMLSQYGAGAREMMWTPSFEIRETDDAFIFKADMPGVRPDDLDITITGTTLQVSGRREQQQEQNEGQYHAYERAYGSFMRTFVLPDTADVDQIRTELKEGELTLVVPKKSGAAQRRKIPIGGGSKA